MAADSVWVCYDAALPYPQDAAFGRGVEDSEGNHRPPAELPNAFEEAISNLAEGTDERFYQVTAADVLTPRSAAEIQAIKDADQAAANAVAQERAAAQANLEQGPPPQSLPGLADRVQALEVLTGLKTYVGAT